MKTFEQEFDYARPLGSGIHGSVYQISDIHAAKFYDEQNVSDPDKECKIAKELYKNNINVPKPEGVFKIDLKAKNTFLSQKHAFVMEYLPGYILEDVPSNEIKRLGLNELAEIELEKARKLGFLTIDSEPRRNNSNQIWCPDRNRIYIIDFVNWVDGRKL
ncbi:MAG: hypothetical protein Q7S33_02325 [Nanoarchaeota archaeon]|nr:hypothetical protein [Nanoarchaeota archaeon]